MWVGCREARKKAADRYSTRQDKSQHQQQHFSHDFSIAIAPLLPGMKVATTRPVAVNGAMHRIKADTSSQCTAPCGDADRAAARTLAIVLAASREMRTAHLRNTTRRMRQYSRTCTRVTNCTFLERGWRVMLPKVVLPRVGLTGASAEIGVWHGHFSDIILSDWSAARGIHYLIDPYKPTTSCGDKGRLDKHCLLDNATFADAYARARRLVSRQRTPPLQRPTQFLRLESLTAAKRVPDASLDFLYVDAAHDHHAVKMDLRAWARKLCPGGLLAGHDFSERGVGSAVHEFLNRRRPLAGLPSPPHELFAARLYVTAEHPSTWFVFRKPAPC